MAETYDRMCRALVPQYDFIQDEVLAVPAIAGAQPTIIDLGGGSGILLEKALAQYPGATCYWIDYSDDFLKVAQQRLAPFDGRITYVISPIEAAWESQVEGAVDLVLSSSAIHHLTGDEKQMLYKRVFDVLKPGGWFFNIDEMKTVYKDAYVASMRRWVDYVAQAQEAIPAETMIYYEKFKMHFDNWTVRNVDNVDVPKVKGDDIHQDFMSQLAWLRESGFVKVDVFIKYHLWCAIGGRKPLGH